MFVHFPAFWNGTVRLLSSEQWRYMYSAVLSVSRDSIVLCESIKGWHCCKIPQNSANSVQIDGAQCQKVSDLQNIKKIGYKKWSI